MNHSSVLATKIVGAQDCLSFTLIRSTQGDMRFPWKKKRGFKKANGDMRFPWKKKWRIRKATEIPRDALSSGVENELRRRKSDPTTAGASGGAFISDCNDITIHGGTFYQILGNLVNTNSPNRCNDLTSSQISTNQPESSNRIYERNLMAKGRGFPVHIPEPSMNLPLAYQREGVSIGDVMYITHNGATSFLFNVCLPAGHPKNPQELPEGFEPISIAPRDINNFSELKCGTHLASSSIERISNPSSQELSFKITGAEGGILVLPEGAYSYNLENKALFRDYCGKHIESWYRYANGPLGRELKNGELGVITGCDKATAYGISVFSNLTEHEKHKLTFTTIGGSSLECSSFASQYKWDYSGTMDAKIGPDLKETEMLRQGDDSDAAVDGKYPNKCLFLRRQISMLGDDIFEALTRDLEKMRVSGSHTDSNHSSSGPSNTQSPNTTQSSQLGAILNSQKGFSSGSYDVDATMIDGTTTAPERSVTFSRSLPSAVFRPSDLLNTTLLQQFPSARVVITEDENWCSVINESEGMPDPTEIVKRVLATHDVREENGVIFLEAIQKKWNDIPILLAEDTKIPASWEGGDSRTCFRLPPTKMTSTSNQFNQLILEICVDTWHTHKPGWPNHISETPWNSVFPAVFAPLQAQ